MVQRYEQTRKLQWYKRGAAYPFITLHFFLDFAPSYESIQSSMKPIACLHRRLPLGFIDDSS